MNERNEIFANNLRVLLADKGMTKIELADELGVGKSIVYEWLKGNNVPRFSMVNKLCDLFHCRISDLMEKDITTDRIIRVGKVKDIYALVETLDNTGIERLLDYAKELNKLYGGENGTEKNS